MPKQDLARMRLALVKKEVDFKTFLSQKKVDDYAQPTKLSHRIKTLKALSDDKNDATSIDIALKLLLCSTRTPCNSPFCPACRDQKHKTKSAEAIELFKNAGIDNLYFLTILLDVTDDLSTIDKQYIDARKKQFRNYLDAKAKLNSAYSEITFSGSFEIDIKRSPDAATDRAKETLQALGLKQGQNSPAYLPHLHLVIHLPGIDREEFCADLKKIDRYNKPYQVRLQSLHSDKSKDENIKRLIGYCHKYRMQYSDNIDTAYEGKAVPNSQYRRTTYKELYEPDLIRDYVKAIHSLNGFQTLSFIKR